MDSLFEAPGKLPSLPALRAFEAAARSGSVARAAEELFVTPGAVSHQIKSLEDQLGYALFVRQGRGVMLTPEGRRLAASCNRLFVGVARELGEIQLERERPRLTITTVPSFSGRWLAPRLGRFIERYPQVELWLQSSKQVEQLLPSGIDLAIRLGPGGWSGVHAEPFFDEYYLVVASPNLPGGLPDSPTALASYSLIRGEGEPWQPWFRMAGLDWPEPSQGLMFSDSGMAVQAAVDGHGIALTRRSLVQDELVSGRLVQLFDIHLPYSWRYWLVTAMPPPYRTVLADFIDWLRAEMQQSIDAIAALPQQKTRK
ncbi:transcriptional regulator GcvA [Chitinimonas sp.]|uniref:transcriptional regulator GcvA n=1 Tax=Chitinimonas sp. TaxID=1934313 RepID=UPI0035AD8504